MKLTDNEFAKWAQALKPCRYCGVKFVGPICPCELRDRSDKRKR